MGIENKIVARRFSPEQRQGLEAVGFTFCMKVQPLSIGQLYEDRELRSCFGYVHGLLQIRSVVPIAREVVVNPKQLALPEAQTTEEFVRQLRERSLTGGTLEGVDFGMDCASVYAQLEFGYQRTFGRKLFSDFFASTIDEIDSGTGSSFLLALVGRRDIGDRLVIPGRHRDDSAPHIRIVLVATPLEICD